MRAGSTDAACAGSRQDAGTILILTLGYVVVALMLAIVVADVSAVYLARRSVASAADGAALAAAQSVNETAIYTATQNFERLPLTDVAATVAQYQTDADPSGRTVLTAELLNPTTVRVTGTRTVDLPVVTILGIGPVTVTASADAQSLVRAPVP
ncbi:pilus assembly protein TadG-related protein [Frankia sp. Cppng1_Ct_nod]|uniref:pilus assembly protein TadG-related protein n=1 Tax=Frankia sp. Cppng1_Ct_nod TaxID=2897162 RepID=UPI002025A9FE|nr:pilus assembly protein TadG-related protein [Frankia sp. Cppng1_Ct_nod]